MMRQVCQCLLHGHLPPLPLAIEGPVQHREEPALLALLDDVGLQSTRAPRKG